MTAIDFSNTPRVGQQFTSAEAKLAALGLKPEEIAALR